MRLRLRVRPLPARGPLPRLRRGALNRSIQVVARRAELLSLLIALPLFYVLGGRSVGALYRSALQRARRDGLTDLDNHRSFQDELARAVGESARYGTTVTLALLDIDDFKFENDRPGHQHGDRLLCELASLLRESRAGDRAFRLGGDEFALLLAHTTEPEADVPLERIRAAIAQSLNGVSVSIGFSAATPEDREPTTLWGRADAALLEAKRRGGNAIVAAAEVVDSVPVVTIEKVRAVRALIDAGAVDVAFQPIWDLSGTRVLGYEALARPRSTELSGPGEAFEIADSIGRGHELDAVCRRAALRVAAQLPGGALLFLNVSPQSLEHDALAGDSLVLAVRGAGYEPEQVVLELARDPNPAGEARAIGAQGAQGFLLGVPAPVPEDAPSYATTLATLSDLTSARERRRIAAALQGGDELYRVLLRTVPDMVVALFDRDLRCQLVDGGLDTIAQWRTLLEGNTVREALSDEGDGERMDELLRPVLDGAATEFEWVGRRSGSHLYVQAVPVRDERAGAIGVMAVCRDLTPRAADGAARSARPLPAGSPAPLR